MEKLVGKNIYKRFFWINKFIENENDMFQIPSTFLTLSQNSSDRLPLSSVARGKRPTVPVSTRANLKKNKFKNRGNARIITQEGGKIKEERYLTIIVSLANKVQ